MRLLLLILMIALLPLRSWALVGEPVEAQTVALNAIKKVAAQAQFKASTGQISKNSLHAHADCHPLTPSADSTAAPEPALALEGESTKASMAELDLSKSTCASCSDCALCHTLAPTLELGVSAAPAPSHWLRPGSKDQFDSALAALSLKPPIA